MRRSRPTLVSRALLITLCVIAGSVANADEESANAPRAVTRDITALKAELQAIRTRLGEVELDGVCKVATRWKACAMGWPHSEHGSNWH